MSKEFLDLSDVARVGVILVRRYYVFDDADPKMFTEDRLRDEKVLVPPEEVPDILTLAVNGKVALARITSYGNGEFVISDNGILCNMLLPAHDAVGEDRPAETGRGGPRTTEADSPDDPLDYDLDELLEGEGDFF